MIEKVLLGFVYDILNKSYVVKAKLPSKETDIFLAVKESILFLDGSDNLDLKVPDLLKSLVDFIEVNVINEIDKLPASYYGLDTIDKKIFLKKTITDRGLMWDTWRNLLSTCSFEELQAELNNLVLRVYPDRSALLVQSARECDQKLKSEIRAHHKNKFYVSFQTQKGLLGGLRIYANSTLKDSSWLGKISLLKSI